MQHVSPLNKTTHTEQNAEPTILGAFKEVPEELVLRILSELSNPRDLASLSATCLDLRRMASDNSLWKLLFAAHFSTAASKTEPSSSLCYVEAYKRAFVLSENLRTGWHRLQTMGNHVGMISCVDGNDQFLCSGAQDGTLKIWDITTHQPVKTLESHGNEVVSVQFVGDRLYTASWTGDVKVWDTASWECVHEIKGVVSNCNQMQVVGDVLYIAEPYPHQIHIFDLTEQKIIQSIPCGRSAGQIFFSQLERKWTFVGDPGDDSITLFNSSGQLQHIFKDNQSPGRIHCIQLSNSLLFTGSSDSTITVWDAKQGDFIERLTGHADSIESLRVTESHLISASRDGVIKIWDVATRKCLHTLDGYQAQYETHKIKKFLYTQINALHFAHGCLFAGSADGKVRVWDFNALPASRYPVRQLESDLELLNKMGALVKEQKYEELASLIAQAENELHPDFQKRIEIYTGILKSIPECTEEALCETVILQLQAEVCIELLLHAVASQNKPRITELLVQLLAIDPSLIEQYKELLQKECDQSECNELMIEAFFNPEAYIEAKIRVIVQWRQEMRQKIFQKSS